MLVAALFRLDRIPGDVLELRLFGLAGGIEQTNAVARHNGDFVIVQQVNGTRVRQQCRNIGRHESFTVDAADDERRSFAHRDNLLRIVHR